MSKCKINIWDRAFDLNVVYECYPGEDVLESQKEAFAMLENNAEEIAGSLEAVIKYVQKLMAVSLQVQLLETSSSMSCLRASLYRT